MNIKILLFALSAAAISSCSTAYKSGQTPDDVYYSPARVTEEDEVESRYEAKRTDPEEREVRMAVHDRRWRDFDDDYDFRYDPYKYGYNYGYYYNPYYCQYPVYITNVIIANPKNSVPRMVNLGTYNNTTYGIVNTKYGNNVYKAPVRQYNNSNNNNSFIRRLLTTRSSSTSSSSSDNSTRSYTPSSSSSSSSSGSSSGSVSRPARGN